MKQESGAEEGQLLIASSISFNKNENQEEKKKEEPQKARMRA